MNPIWVLVNCNSQEEAESIGDKVLAKRFASCFDIYSRQLAKFFWPPRKGEIESAKGSLLILETDQDKYQDLQEFVKTNHSDDLPFIGFINIQGVSEEYKDWLKGEVNG
jgi:periplasmic divalent cation tolerance protein